MQRAGRLRIAQRRSVPTALGANPSMTTAALAQRGVAHITERSD
jgi:choline dehydrogenase-like flavoprotein